jgi:hypothetical protein
MHQQHRRASGGRNGCINDVPLVVAIDIQMVAHFIVKMEVFFGCANSSNN